MIQIQIGECLSQTVNEQPSGAFIFIFDLSPNFSNILHNFDRKQFLRQQELYTADISVEKNENINLKNHWFLLSHCQSSCL